MLEKHRRRAVGVPYALAFWAELSVQRVEMNSEVAFLISYDRKNMMKHLQEVRAFRYFWFQLK